MTRNLRHQLEHVPTGILQSTELAGIQSRGRIVQRSQERIDEKVGGMRSLGGAGARLVLGDDAVVNLLEVLLHLVRSGELLLTHRTRKHLPIVALVIEERVPLETVLVLKALDNLDLLALDAPVGAVAGDVGVLEQV